MTDTAKLVDEILCELAGEREQDHRIHCGPSDYEECKYPDCAGGRQQIAEFRARAANLHAQPAVAQTPRIAATPGPVDLHLGLPIPPKEQFARDLARAIRVRGGLDAYALADALWPHLAGLPVPKLAAAVRPGDTLVIAYGLPIDPARAAAIKARFAEALPRTPIVILDQAAALAVATPEEGSSGE